MKVEPIDILEMHSGLEKATIEKNYKWVLAAMNEYGSRCAIEAASEEPLSDGQDEWTKVDGKNFPPDNPKYYYWLYSESIDNYESGYYDFYSKCFKSSTGDRLFHVTHWKLPTPPDIENKNSK